MCDRNTMVYTKRFEELYRENVELKGKVKVKAYEECFDALTEYLTGDIICEANIEHCKRMVGKSGG